MSKRAYNLGADLAPGDGVRGRQPKAQVLDLGRVDLKLILSRLKARREFVCPLLQEQIRVLDRDVRLASLYNVCDVGGVVADDGRRGP